MIKTQEDLDNALKDPKKFKEMINGASDLIQAGMKFPRNAEELIRQSVQNPGEWGRLYPNADEIMRVRDALHVVFENNKAIKPNVNLLVQPLVNDPSLFKTYVQSPIVLKLLTKDFTEAAEGLMKHVIEDPKVFQQLTKPYFNYYQSVFSKSDGTGISKELHDIFHAPNLEAALEMVKRRAPTVPKEEKPEVAQRVVEKAASIVQATTPAEGKATNVSDGNKKDAFTSASVAALIAMKSHASQPDIKKEEAEVRAKVTKRYEEILAESSYPLPLLKEEAPLSKWVEQALQRDIKHSKIRRVFLEFKWIDEANDTLTQDAPKALHNAFQTLKKPTLRVV